MSASVVTEVSGSCRIGGSDFGLAGVRAEISVNSWPHVSCLVTVGLTSTGAAKQIDEKIFKLIGGWQNKILNSSLLASVSWHASSGVGSTVSGYVVSVGLVVSYGDMCANVMIIPKYAAMDAINMAMYKHTLHMGGDQRDNLDSMRPKLTSDLMSYIHDTVEWMFKRWELKSSELMQDLSDEEKEMYNKQHTVNKDLIHYFYDILDNSYAGLEYTKSSMSILGVEATHKLCEVIVNCLTAAQGSFLSTIVALANLFRLLYVPEPNSVGRLISKTEMANGDIKSSKGAGTKDAVVNASANTGLASYLPVTTVITVLDTTSDDMRRNILRRSSHGNSATAGSGSTGRTIQISPPEWIPTNLAICKIPDLGKKPTGKKPSLQEAHKKVVDKQRTLLQKNYFSDLLHNWCVLELCAQLIGGATTQLTTFLDDFMCGVRKKEAFGSGFITGCAIDIILRGGLGTARTMYTYTHVLYTGAKMPEIN